MQPDTLQLLEQLFQFQMTVRKYKTGFNKCLNQIVCLSKIKSELTIKYIWNEC